jgi:hypothetical protein
MRKMEITGLTVSSEIITPSAKAFTAYTPDTNENDASTKSYRGVIYHPVDKKFMAHTISSQGIWSSGNGIDWVSEKSVAFGVFIYTMIYVDAWDMVIALDDSAFYFKIDGGNWVQQVIGGFEGGLYSCVYDASNDVLIIGGTAQELSYISKQDIIDGNDATQFTSKPSDIGNIWSLATDGTKIIGCDANNSKMYVTSDGGSSWITVNNPNATNYGLAYSSKLGLWSCVGTNGVSYSTDGLAWASGSITGTGWYRLIWEPTNEIFMAVSDTNNELIAYSKDGINYTTAYSDSSGDARGIAYSTERKIFCAIGDVNTETVMLSTKNSDGVTYYG